MFHPSNRFLSSRGRQMGCGVSFGCRCKINGVSGFITTIHSDTYTPHQPMAVQNINSNGTITETEVGEIMAGVEDGKVKINDIYFPYITKHSTMLNYYNLTLY